MTAADLVGRRVRVADGRYGVIERAVHRAGAGVGAIPVLVLTVRVGAETFELKAKNVELVS